MSSSDGPRRSARVRPWCSLALVLGASLTSGCILLPYDAGSGIRFVPADDDTCMVSMHRGGSDYTIDMVLGCADGHRECFTVRELNCQGVDKPDSVPIDLTREPDGCPYAGYCVRDCEVGVDTPGSLWDMPSLQAVEGCNIYEGS